MGQKLFVKIKNLLKKKKVLTVIGLLVVLFFLFGRKKKTEEFKTEKVTRGEIREIVDASGAVNAESDIKVQFQTSGKMVWLGVKEGDLVKKGQALASLDKEGLKKSFEKYMNLYMTNRWDFEQQQEDYKTIKENKLLSDEMKRILDKYQFSLNNAVLDVEISDLAVKYATIYSPIEGIVVEISPPVAGMNILSASAFIEVIEPKTLEFTAIIDETDIGKLKDGQKAIITLDSFPDKEFIGIVKRIDFKSTTTSSGGTGFTAHISLPAEEIGSFRDGMNGDLRVTVQSKENVLLLPTASLVEKDSKNYVFKINKGKAVEIEVKTGLSNDDQIELTSGELTEGDLLVTEPSKVK